MSAAKRDAVPVADTARIGEAVHMHTRLLKCALEVDDARAYWRHVGPDDDDDASRTQRAFAEYWFGARSMPRIKVLMTNFRARFDAFPEGFDALRRWTDMDPQSRALICHWHLQLTDPLYRAFTGSYLVGRHEQLTPTTSRDRVTAWVADQGAARWTTATRIQFASKLLSSAYAAGLVTTRRDPRQLCFPRVGDDALTYLLYLLRGVAFEGTLVDNPYLGSVGLVGGVLTDRLRQLPALNYRRMGELNDLGWAFPSLRAWSEARFPAADAPAAGASTGGDA